jgi:hypothetical protein
VVVAEQLQQREGTKELHPICLRVDMLADISDLTKTNTSNLQAK